MEQNPGPPGSDPPRPGNSRQHLAIRPPGRPRKGAAMKCPNCGSTNVTILDRWMRECQDCLEVWEDDEPSTPLSEHNHQEEEQP